MMRATTVTPTLIDSLLVACLLTACGGGGTTSTPLATEDLIQELVICRSEIDRPQNTSETLIRTAAGLGTWRIPARAGLETGIRVNPTATRVAFARQRRSNEPESTELYVAPLDNSEPQKRLTINSHIDEAPCWSPDGESLVFTSEALGSPRLWLVSAEGGPGSEFLASTEADRDPDWHWGSDRIVFSRFDTSLGRWRLMLVNGDGTGLVALTDGGTTGGAESGDREAAFRPDGTRIAFSRVTSDESAALMEVEIATGTVREILAGDRSVRRPRWTPAADQILVTVAEPAAGRPGQRLARVLPDGTGLALMLPDERFTTPGFDPLPTYPALPTALAPQILVYDSDSVVIAGIASFATVDFLRQQDQTPVIVVTRTENDREVAGVNIVAQVPEDIAPEDILSVRVKVIASARRFDGDSQMRVTLRNHVERRFDTVVERDLTGDDWMEFEFDTTSLAHVDRNGFISAAVIADLDPGDRSEMWVDLFEIEITTKAP